MCQDDDDDEDGDDDDNDNDSDEEEVIGRDLTLMVLVEKIRKMMLFRPVNSLVVCINLWLIL